MLSNKTMKTMVKKLPGTDPLIQDSMHVLRSLTERLKSLLGWGITVECTDIQLQP